MTSDDCVHAIVSAGKLINEGQPCHEIDPKNIIGGVRPPISIYDIIYVSNFWYFRALWLLCRLREI